MKRRIVFIIESLNIGGAEKALVALLHHLDYSRFDVTLKVIAQGGQLFKFLPSRHNLTIETILASDGSFIDKVKSKAFYKWLPACFIGTKLTNGFDIAISFCEGHATKWVAASFTKCKKIAWVHTDLLHFNWPEKIGVYKSHQEHIDSYKMFDTVVAVSSEAANCFNAAFNYNSAQVIHNILDPQIVKLSQDVYPDFKFNTTKFNIVAVGRHEYVKGFDILIEAVALLPVHIKNNVHLYLIGDGSQHTALVRLAAVFNLSKNITFTGNQLNPYQYISRANLYICPSRQEGFNIALLEAMSLATPVIATNCAGPRDILNGGKYGILIECTPQAVSKSIADVYSNNQHLKQLSRLAAERAEHFSAVRQLEKFYHLLDS